MATDDRVTKEFRAAGKKYERQRDELCRFFGV